MVGSSAFNSARPIVIAEIGTNHNRDLAEAEFLIAGAAQAGCDFVKFQIYEASEIISPIVKAEDYGWDSLFGVSTVHEAFDRILKTPKEWFPHLGEFARKQGIGWGVTLHGLDGIKWAHTVGPDFIKVASMDHSNTPFIRQLMDSFNVPLVISLGMAEVQAIQTLVGVLSTRRDTSILMHCSSLYPPNSDELRLSNIAYLRSQFGFEVGFSDHSIGIDAAIEATSLGATVFEKHITRDTTQQGPDHAFAVTVEALSEYVKCIQIQSYDTTATSQNEFISLPDREKALQRVYLKSIHAARDLYPGDSINKEDIYFARPGFGISPSEVEKVLGRTVIKAVEANTPVTLSHLTVSK